MEQPEEWREQWQQYEQVDATGSRRLVADVCSGIDMFADDEDADPEVVIALAIAGAKAAEAAAGALEAEWALYTPQQAAVVASALFAQLDATGRGLERLGEYLHVMAARGDAEMPEYDSDEGDRNLNDAEMALGCAGEEAQGCVAGADRAVRSLTRTPFLGTLPTTPHETICAVAQHVDVEAKLLCDHHVHDEAELADSYSGGFGCGCRIELTDTSGTVWEFHRGDSAWCLLRLADIGDDGILRNCVELGPSNGRAHPGHLSTLIEQALSATH
ncbi:hypothetical protein [Streptomyces celluloflavus]|uniref:hypothetical protein n=1 Tax=Streptomyces celluloflavus TaxID=58344 RepID=UPI0036C451AC